MATSDQQTLAEAQRETVSALASLTEQLRTQGAGTPGESSPADTAAPPVGNLNAGSSGAEFQRTLDSAAQAIGDLDQATTANTQAMSGLSRDIGNLPAVLAGLAGGVQGGGSVLGSVFSGGLGLVPLGLKIASLFSGGSSETPAAPTKFTEPPSLALEVANTENVLAGFPRVDQNQQGEPRVVQQQGAAAPQQHITVNVSAMDSRSFLDHSDDIARAVREAMLYMHPVNDFISEL